MMPDRQERRRALIRLNQRDLVRAFKLDRWAFLVPLVVRLARRPAESFADEVLGFDDAVEAGGLLGGGEYVLKHFAGSVTVLGPAVPSSGPLIVASNHPGMVDAMAVWVAMGRSDLKIIAAERDLLEQLPSTLEHLILVKDGSTSAMRSAIEHLKSGGALLTFPAGNIEPDPSSSEVFSESFSSWSLSVAALAKRVSGTCIVPVIVSGVISPSARAHPVLRLFRNPKDRDWAAATLQILVRRYRRVHVTVRFGAALDAAQSLLNGVQNLADQVREHGEAKHP